MAIQSKLLLPPVPSSAANNALSPVEATALNLNQTERVKVLLFPALLGVNVNLGLSSLLNLRELVIS